MLLTVLNQFSILNWVRTPLFCPWIMIIWLESEFLFFSIRWQTLHCRVGVAVCNVSMWRIALLLLAKSLIQSRQRHGLFLSFGSTCTKFSSYKPKYQNICLNLKLGKNLGWYIYSNVNVLFVTNSMNSSEMSVASVSRLKHHKTHVTGQFQV